MFNRITLVGLRYRICRLGLLAMVMAAGWGSEAPASTLWNGPVLSFSKASGANPNLAADQDRLTPNVWITRGSSQGLYNAKTEPGFTHFNSPTDTEWANGILANYATLTYTDW